MRRAALLALLACSACPRQLPLRFGPEGEIRDPAVLLRALADRSRRLQTLTAGGRITVHGAHGGTTGVEIAAQKPAFLRVEVDGFFGNPQALLATDGRRVEIFRVDEGVFAVGAATPDNLARLLPAALPPDVAVGLLLADPPRLPTVGGLRVDPGRRAYALTLEGAGEVQTLFLDTETLALVGAEQAGSYAAAFADLAPTAGVAFPRQISLEVGSAALEIRYRDVHLGEPIDPAMFELAPPKGARLVPLDG
ncbi:MAG TPA: hypothetical protein VMB50_10965 [Myxococcales bacterium]|nr:hypothetical protein [Myxococcales bacterium]